MPQTPNPTGNPLRFIQAGGTRTVYGAPNGPSIPQAAGAQIVTDPAPAAAPATDVVAVTLAGTSSLSATTAENQVFAVTLAGTSTLTAGAVELRPFTVALAGTSALSATAGEPHPIAVTLAGTSSLAASVAEAHTFTVTLAGAGSLAASAAEPHPLVVALAGSSTLAASVTQLQRFVVTLAGHATLTAAPTELVPVVVEVAGSSSLTANAHTGISFATITVTLAGQGSLAVTPVQPVVAETVTGLGVGSARWFPNRNARTRRPRILTLPPVTFAGRAGLTVTLSSIPTVTSTPTPVRPEPVRIHHVPAADTIDAELAELLALGVL